MFNAAISADVLSKRAQALRERMDVKHKSALAQDIGPTLDHTNLSEIERSLAEEIVEKLVHDEIVAVRAAIAQAVAGSPHLPGRIARKLAEDIEEVCIPVLELSPVLEEKVLENIINSGIPRKIWAIAGRDHLSENLCRKIVASGRTNAVVRLLKNPTAQITNQTMVTIVRVYGDDKNIEQAIFERGELPDDVIETLRELAEAHVAAFIQRYFNLPEHMVDVDKGRELLERKDERRNPSRWWDSSKKGAV